MSIDPLLVVPELPPVVVTLPVEVGAEIRPGQSAREAQPGMIVLNTRGYNYGPPPAAIDPAAMGEEATTP